MKKVKKIDLNFLKGKIKKDIEKELEAFIGSDNTESVNSNIRNTILGYFKTIKAPYIDDYSILSDESDENFFILKYDVKFTNDNGGFNETVKILKSLK